MSVRKAKRMAFGALLSVLRKNSCKAGERNRIRFDEHIPLNISDQQSRLLPFRAFLLFPFLLRFRY